MREYFRDWIENFETFILEVIFEERHDWRAKLTRAFLFAGSKIFQVLVIIRRWLYNVRILRDKTLWEEVTQSEAEHDHASSHTAHAAVGSSL